MHNAQSYQKNVDHSKSYLTVDLTVVSKLKQLKPNKAKSTLLNFYSPSTSSLSSSSAFLAGSDLVDRLVVYVDRSSIQNNIFIAIKLKNKLKYPNLFLNYLKV